MSTAKRIVLIIASTRTPRVGPSIAEMVLGVLTPLLPTDHSLTLVDLVDHPLPLHTTEPMIPAGLPSSSPAYADVQTNTWSTLIRSFDGFIFLTAQYNWGYPAPLKLALDALYHEWAAKPACVVSYGGRGGGKAAGQLRQVLAGLHMRVCERGVELAFAKGHDVAGGELKEETHERWRVENKKEELEAAWMELVQLLAKDS
ncbi:flavoprotein-like protein [Roridomyces roridus]|uniref:Flavoprotein-like protein n=1 Tax=Roridomyces roridus TaxID=1738132 RepID=A0AAD7FU61_9AGAR|nr:flavoprotein-like protein [Roridomyces roridus]